MTRHRLFFFTLLLVLYAAPAAIAQQSEYSLYFLNLAASNPGFTGYEDYTDLKFSFRQGWNNFGVTNSSAFVSCYSPLNNGYRSALKGNTLRISSPDKLERVRQDKRLVRKQSIGGMLYERKLGPYSLISVTANYAYHLPLSSKVSMSFGTRISYNSQRIDLAGYTVRDPINDDFYQQIMAAGQGTMGATNIDFGAVVYSSKFYFGVSSVGLVQSHVSGNAVLTIQENTGYSLQTAYYGIRAGSELTISPAFRAYYLDQTGFQWNASLRARFRDTFYIGAGYSGTVSRLSFLTGYTFGRYSVNYSYDQYLSDLNNFSVSMHEFTLGVTLFNKYGVRTKIW